MNCIFKPHFGESYWVRFGMEVEVELGYWGCSLDEKERFQGNTLKEEIESKKESLFIVLVRIHRHHHHNYSNIQRPDY